VIKAVYEEVSRIADAVNVKMLEYPEEAFWSKGTIMSVYFKAAFDKEGTVGSISGPSSMKSRYITEDVPYGLVPIAHLAYKFNVAIPIIDAIIELSSVINEMDYRHQGRQLEELGIADLDKDTLNRVLQEGF